jgi:glycosyltransferase involved in cell wall biosynthesis
MRFHVVSLPHTQTSDDFASCAYTQKVVRFCNMMKSQGHHVTLYAGAINEAECDELVSIITVPEQAKAMADLKVNHYLDFPWTDNPLWRKFNAAAIGAILERLEPRDFICLIGGTPQRIIANAFPEHMSVEFGIGYAGTFAKYRVFESYAWMHTVAGAGSSNIMAEQGRWFDDVIPNQFDERHTLGDGKGGYALYLGRITELKGYKIAQDACIAAGVPLVLAGPGKGNGGYGKFVGEVTPEERVKLLQGACCLVAPTQYIEPFGTVAIEAMACGTPVICSDWGGFTDTVEPGVGLRCRTLKDFVNGVRAAAAGDFTRSYIANHAKQRYSMPVVAEQYEEYFARLMTLWDKGWNQL